MMNIFQELKLVRMQLLSPGVIRFDSMSDEFFLVINRHIVKLTERISDVSPSAKTLIHTLFCRFKKVSGWTVKHRSNLKFFPRGVLVSSNKGMILDQGPRIGFHFTGRK